jgi:hypothetical protein
MDKSDWKKLGLGGLAGVAVAADIDVDVVEFLEFLSEHPIPLPNCADGHSAMAAKSTGVAIEVPCGNLMLTGHAPTAL